MSRRHAMQQYFNLGAADHLNLLHHAHKSNIAIATNIPNFGGWQERTLPHQAGIARAVHLAANSVPNCYVSQNAFQQGKSRSFSSISCFANCFVDLDTYNIAELAGLDPKEILHRIVAQNPGMPRPTMYASSGRGMYCLLYTSPSPRD